MVLATPIILIDQNLTLENISKYYSVTGGYFGYFFLTITFIFQFFIYVKVINYSIKTLKNVLQKELELKKENLSMVIKYLKIDFAAQLISLLTSPFISYKLKNTDAEFTEFLLRNLDIKYYYNFLSPNS